MHICDMCVKLDINILLLAADIRTPGTKCRDIRISYCLTYVYSVAKEHVFACIKYLMTPQPANCFLDKRREINGGVIFI